MEAAAAGPAATTGQAVAVAVAVWAAVVGALEGVEAILPRRPNQGHPPHTAEIIRIWVPPHDVPVRRSGVVCSMVV